MLPKSNREVARELHLRPGQVCHVEYKFLKLLFDSIRTDPRNERSDREILLDMQSELGLETETLVTFVKKFNIDLRRDK